ncbi:MAG: 5'/3'-nucleotidase SurE [Solirubrobacteraceae bacterium]|nr:5'/3'-nucleotidase SurE [Solirubrobacteraceae bacterium]
MRRLVPFVTALACLAVAAPASAAPLHVLVTNDDGVRAEGIDEVVRALRAEPGVRVTIVAPAGNQSGTGGLTTRGALSAYPAQTKSGIPATAVRGYPADSVRYALEGPLAADRPDLVVSGINDGANLGPARNNSGTVGAARAAARRGLPALATSQGSASPTRFEDGVEATIGWLRANRDHLAPGTVQNLNIPTCRAGGHILGVLSVPAANGWDLDMLLSLSGAVTCRGGAIAPRDDVRAFRQGYAALSPIRS